MTRLHIIHGPEKGRSFELPEDAAFLGRSPENDIQIKDNSVSRRHLRIVNRDGRIFIEDLKSTNNTFLDGKLVVSGREYEVKPGLPIAVGKVLLCIGESVPEDAARTVGPKASADEFAETAIFETYKDRPMTTSKNLELIYKVAHVLMESLDLNELFDKIMDYLFEFLTRIDRGAILLINRETGKAEQIIARSKFDREKSFSSYSRTIVNKVITEGVAITMPDVKQEGMDDLSASMGIIRSVMCVPLISRSEVRGVIYVDSVNMPHGFRKEDVALLVALSSPAAVAIENALLYANLEEMVANKSKTLRKTEKRLRQSEARFKAIFDNMSSGVKVCRARKNGESFVVVDLNRAGQEMEDIREKASIIGKDVAAVFPHLRETGLLEVFRRVWKTGQPENCPVVLYREGEVASWREYYVYRLPSGEIVSIVDDISERKRAEARQKALQEQLFASQKMETIGAFAGGTAHNFRNILQAISGNMEYLELMYGDQPEAAEIAGSIYGSVEKGVDLINNLLHFSKRGGKIERVDLDLADVIRETYAIIEKVFDKKILVDLKLTEGLFIKGNRSLLSQVLMNLCSNARDAMPEGGRLTIEAKKRGKRVIVTVTDTGHGMDRETLGKVFDPFFTLKEVGKGTGLGLSTSLGIVEQHKGKISVSSTPGKGTAFEISFPVERAEKVTTVEKRPKILLGKGEKILIVDDEPTALEALSNLIRSLGYEPISVDVPGKAVKNYRKWAPDAVLMDRSMPGMDGITCIRKIKDMDPSARIIIVSGYEATGPNGIDADAGALIKGYLTKPCGREDLGRMLATVLSE